MWLGMLEYSKVVVMYLNYHKAAVYYHMVSRFPPNWIVPIQFGGKWLVIGG